MFALHTTKFSIKNSDIILMCCLWISEQTAALSFKSINRLVFYNEGRECLLCGTHWILI